MENDRQQNVECRARVQRSSPPKQQKLRGVKMAKNVALEIVEKCGKCGKCRKRRECGKC